MMMPTMDRDRSVRASRLKDTDRVMLINQDRVLYCGLLGERSVMMLGSITLYVSLGRPFRICIDDGPWQEKSVALVEPFAPHQLSSQDRLIASLNIEPESVDLSKVPGFAVADEDVAQFELEKIAARIRGLYAKLVAAGCSSSAEPLDLDLPIFGAPLPRRGFDARIESVMEQIKAKPCDQFPAEQCAAELGLSFSRFLHLFREETGTTFRRFRAWKRARSLLQYVNLNVNLTDVALEVGYPDASHFSHSIRQVYGLKPKDIFAGSRRLAVLT
jgi:hypothetical protein